MAPKVSVIIRTHNAECFLPALLESLGKQTFQDFEIVAVIHACKDRSESILKAAGARIVQYPTSEAFNYSRALNIGAEAAGGAYLLNLSSHVEIVRADTLAKMLEAIEKEGLAAVTVARRFPREPYSKKEKFGMTDSGNFQGSGGMANFCGLLPRTLWKQHAFPTEVPAVEDSAWATYWIRKGYRTAWLNGHAVAYKNPRYSGKKLVRDRCIIALLLGNQPASITFQQLSSASFKKAKRWTKYMLRNRVWGLFHPILVEATTAFRLRLLSCSTNAQKRWRDKLLRENPGLDTYLRTYVKSWSFNDAEGGMEAQAKTASVSLLSKDE